MVIKFVPVTLPQPRVLVIPLGMGILSQYLLPPFDWLNSHNDNLWQGVNGTNNPCPSGFRLPTETEWETERASWSSNDRDGAWDSPLKLQLAGHRNSNLGFLSSVGSIGSYWSSTVDGLNASHLFFYNGRANVNFNYRANGLSVRCIQD